MSAELTFDALNRATAGDFAAALANVFEHSSWIAEATARGRPFASLAALRDAMMAAISAAAPKRRLELIRAHPDLANRTQRAAGLTAESTVEQDGAGLDRLSETEFALFERLNNAYRAKFAFPFILCVRRHTKDSILDRFQHRLTNSPTEEEAEALREIGRIATLRLAALVEDDATLSVNGRLSTHVLDTHGGRPAAGLALELVELSRQGADRLIAKTITNDDGRTDAALIGGRPVPIGTYELRFHAAAYYASNGVPLSAPPFLDTIPIRFGVSAPEGHLHVPLLMTPWSYSTYRGS